MIAQPIRRQVPPNGEIARLLEEIGDTPILLEKDGTLYRLAKEDDIWADYEPSRTRLALQKSAGALNEVEREQLLNDLYQARLQ